MSESGEIKIKEEPIDYPDDIFDENDYDILDNLVQATNDGKVNENLNCFKKSSDQFNEEEPFKFDDSVVKEEPVENLAAELVVLRSPEICRLAENIELDQDILDGLKTTIFESKSRNLLPSNNLVTINRDGTFNKHNNKKDKLDKIDNESVSFIRNKYINKPSTSYSAVNEGFVNGKERESKELSTSHQLKRKNSVKLPLPIQVKAEPQDESTKKNCLNILDGQPKVKKIKSKTALPETAIKRCKYALKTLRLKGPSRGFAYTPTTASLSDDNNEKNIYQSPLLKLNNIQYKFSSTNSNVDTKTFGIMQYSEKITDLIKLLGIDINVLRKKRSLQKINIVDSKSGSGPMPMPCFSHSGTQTDQLPCSVCLVRQLTKNDSRGTQTVPSQCEVAVQVKLEDEMPIMRTIGTLDSSQLSLLSDFVEIIKGSAPKNSREIYRVMELYLSSRRPPKTHTSLPMTNNLPYQYQFNQSQSMAMAGNPSFQSMNITSNPGSIIMNQNQNIGNIPIITGSMSMPMNNMDCAVNQNPYLTQHRMAARPDDPRIRQRLHPNELPSNKYEDEINRGNTISTRTFGRGAKRV